MAKEIFINYFLAEGWQLGSIVMLGVLGLLFLIQILYYLIAYGRIRSYRNPSPSEEASQQGLSVVVALYEADRGFLYERLPLLLGQRKENYEVVVVDVSGDVEVREQLELMRIGAGERLTTTKLAADPRLHISTKMALNVGIKAARYENILFTLPECSPRTDRWADMMAKAFVGHDVVLGYASIAPTKGLLGRVIRCANMALSARWLSHAVRHRPYRGNLCNLGITKRAYFEARGFNHLNLNMGEDDLFVMKIANRTNTATIMGGSATVDQKIWGGLGWWMERRLKLSYPYRYYPLRVKLSTGLELWSRGLFFMAVALVAAFLPLYAKVAAGALLLLRFVVVWWQMKRVERRLSERGVMSLYWLYDLVAPLVEAVLAVWRRNIPKYKWR